MSGRIIQQDDHRAAQMPQQLAQKEANLLLPNVIEVELIVQAQALSVLGPTRIRTKLLHLGPTLAGGIARCHSKRRIVKTLMARAVARIGLCTPASRSSKASISPVARRPLRQPRSSSQSLHRNSCSQKREEQRASLLVWRLRSARIVSISPGALRLPRT